MLLLVDYVAGGLGRPQAQGQEAEVDAEKRSKEGRPNPLNGA